MFCPNCGTKAMTAATFCHQCGSHLNDGYVGQGSSSSRPVYETCKVGVFIVANSFLVPFRQRTWQWSAKGFGPDGAYTVATSRPFKAPGGNENTGPLTAAGKTPIESEEARAHLIADLLRAGWEPLDANGREFRRTLGQAWNTALASPLFPLSTTLNE
jgi:hypothetical protein